MSNSFVLSLVLVLFLAVGCQPAARRHRRSLPNKESEKLTTGVVQKKVFVGMPQAEVNRVLGFPSIVTKDPRGKEAWIYDGAAREVSHTLDQGGVWVILGGNEQEAEASQSIKKTITVVIKFEGGVVNNVTYHSSQF